MSERPSFSVEYLEPPVPIDAEPLPDEFSAPRLKRALLILGGIVVVIVAAILLAPGLDSLRDRFNCQYCGSPEDLTFDHIIPRSKGGQTTWENVVAACSPCNLRKGNLTPQQARMFPRQFPFAPTVHQLHRNGRLFPPNYLHDSWLDYLYWDTELDP